MPNWSEGILKVRGNYENVVKFFKENLQTVDLFGTNVESALIIDDYDDSVEINLKKTAYIKGTRRNFTESDYIYIFTVETIIRRVYLFILKARGVSSLIRIQKCLKITT